MTQMFQCGDNPALVGYMYGECEPEQRRAIEEHLVACPACAAELDALGATRRQLAAWTPPEAQLDFQIVRAHPSTIARGALSNVEGQGSGPRTQKETGQKRSPWLGGLWGHPLPAWAQVAAAVVIFGAGLSLGVLRGTIAPASTPAVTSVAATPVAVQPRTASITDLAALEQRLRAEMAQIRTASTTRAAASSSQASSDSDILARVRTLIEESEQRQQRELALRTAQVVRDVESQRRVDMQNVRSIVGQMEGTTGAEIARQQQTLQYLMRVSQQR